jgi:outer membrane immunogenic protein
MKRLLLASVGLVALAAATVPASAADLRAPRPAAAPAAVMPIYNWTGFYIGAHVGWGHTDKEWTHTDPVIDLLFIDRHGKADGFLGGGQVGFNWQTGALVLGVEGQFSWVDWEKRDHCFGAVGSAFEVHCGHSVDWVATLAARIGFAAANWLFYVKGGVAFADENFHVHSPLFATTVHSNGDHEVGWMVGAGIEYGFTPNWSAKVEYNFMDFGDSTVHFRDATGLIFDDRIKIDQQVHVVKFGINYRFAPVAAPLPVRAAY